MNIMGKETKIESNSFIPKRHYTFGYSATLIAVTLLFTAIANAQDGEPKVTPETESATPSSEADAKQEKTIVDLSKNKWRWMAERNVDALDALFHDEAVFVHMGGAMPKERELDVIRSGAIQYKDAQIQETSVRFIGSTAILLNRIRLVAVVGGNEVVNPFMVTEVYVKQDDTWKLGSLSFTRLLGQ